MLLSEGCGAPPAPPSASPHFLLPPPTPLPRLPPLTKITLHMKGGFSAMPRATSIGPRAEAQR